MSKENTGRTTITVFKQTKRKNNKLGNQAMTSAKVPK